MTPQLKCVKWQQSDNICRCLQNKDCYCGCDTRIESPSINNILAGIQADRQQENIDAIKNSIKHGQTALALGAGISKPCEMPLWGSLISQMMGYAVQYDLIAMENPRFYSKESPEGIRLLEQSKNLINGDLHLLGRVNALEAAEYVVQLFNDGESSGTLRRCLEEGAVDSMIRQIINRSKTPEKLLLAKCPDVEKGIPVIEAVKKAGIEKVAALNTMFAVSYLLSADSGIRRAMTYNYDPLVQEHMMDLYGMEEEKLLTHPGKWGEGATGSADVREIYHVHGFVPGQRHLEKSCSRVFPKQSGPLVLSEDSYYRIEREEAYNWSSSIQSNFLNKYNCLFVGFSADDYNFRRILRQRGDMNMEKQTHYLILSVDEWIQDIYEDVCRASIQKDGTIALSDMDKISQDAILLLQYVLEARANYWKRFEIIPIWITVAEIPQLLTSLLNS